MLSPGTRLGAYEIQALVGEGGMGEVYKARDPRLNRSVALKLLPPAFATDAERLARFEREAQVLASLNHPHIAGLYGIEESDGVRALVMELVDGPTLADRIAHGAIPLDEVPPIARQIAEALESAHEAGIVHRDLKPANIKLRPDGTVKVLDFGLAKATDSSAPAGSFTNSPTITSPAMMTHGGMILGTAAYMSPEQAKGKAVDRRADIWAFGAVLYEMLSGRRAFAGEDISDTLAAVLREPIDLGALPPSTPPSLRLLIVRCLERDVRKRLRDIGEARITLEQGLATVTHGTAASHAVAGALDSGQPRWKRASLIVATALVAAIAAGAAAWYLKPVAAPIVTRFADTPPDGVTWSSSNREFLNISSDGTQIVYVASNRLYIRRLSELDGRPVPGTEAVGTIFAPAFSPDGRSIAFWASDNTIKRVPAEGGALVTVCETNVPFGISWTPDGIVFAVDEKVMRVSPHGTKPEVIATARQGELVHGPQLLPDGRHVLFAVTDQTSPDRWDKARIVAQPLGSSDQWTVIDGGSNARYVPTGHLLYAVGGVVFAAPFDLSRVQTRGPGVPVVVGVRRSIPTALGAAHFAVSSTGTLVYVPGPAARMVATDLALIDRDGSAQPLKLPPGGYAYPRVSPDGRRMALTVASGREEFIAIQELSGATAMRRLTLGGKSRFPIWTSDGRRVAYQSDREGDAAIFWQPADGSGAAERLTRPGPGESHIPDAWSPTSDTLLFGIQKQGEHTLWMLSIPDRNIAPFGAVQSTIPINAVFSPDGRWVAYQSDVSGRPTIYVQPVPPTGAVHQFIARGADVPHEPVWSPDGRELFYNPRAGGFEVVAVTTNPEFAFGNPVPLPRPFQLAPPQSRRSYDIAHDGRVIALIVPGADADGGFASQRMDIVLNWFEELKRLTTQ